MALERVLEPEVMDTEEEAVDYDSMDHSEVNQWFVNDLLAFSKSTSNDIAKVLDLGTGTALIPIELCKAHSSCQVVAIDMAEHMLALAQRNVERNNFEHRISLKKVDAKRMVFGDGEFGCVMSNSIIHHIPEPANCIQDLVRVAATGGVIFLRDLMRPNSDEQVKTIVQQYAGNENTHSQQMFDDSLRAALSLDEIRTLVAANGFDPKDVQASSDRHWTWASIKN